MFSLNQKFGATPDEAVDLLRAAERLGLYPCGTAFHVGSQRLDGTAGLVHWN
ncbi:MAG: hypothetical protein H5T74_11040 [Actinobacteria bacterium]|nr:hypothetical protein [Actinomycetota bacterium]